MSIRLKLILPLLLLALSLGVILNLIWIPKYKNDTLIDVSVSETAYIEMLSSSLIPAILSSDLSQIHATLDDVLSKREKWNYIELKNNKGIILYPYEKKNKASNLDKFNYEIIHEEPLAQLSIYLDIDNIVQAEMRNFNHFSNMIILTIFFVTIVVAIVFDTWIRRPLDGLAKAALKLADGDFDVILPSKTNDEIGSLIHAFDTMKENINLRQKELNQQNHLLSIIGQVASLYIRDIDPRSLFEFLLTELIEYTESEFGFIGIVQTRGDGSQYLKVLAITNISWSKETQELFIKNQETGLEFNNLASLFGAAITSRETIISNNPESDPRSCGVPTGHPKLESFIGVPLKRSGEVIAMFGLANKINGYNQQLIDNTQPLVNACTTMIEAYQNNQKRVLAENTLKDRELRMSTILESIIDAIITTDEKGFIETYNQAAETIFGYKAEELIGKNIAALVPSEHNHKHDEYIQAYLEGRESQIIGVGREVSGITKNGESLPLEVAITEMRMGERLVFCVVARDVSERKRIEKMKNEFLANVSHELRTPLTSIRGAIGLLASGNIVQLTDNAKKLTNIASNNTERLLRLINDLLDMEKIDSGMMKFENTLVNINELVARSIEDNQAYADQYRVEIKTVGEIPKVSVFADINRLMQVMSNLISNAAKFSDPKSSIGISSEVFEDMVKISVIDHGCGIPENFKNKLFDKFTQSDSSSTRKVGGTGLGLSISKAIVEKQNGRLLFTSEENVGTTFIVELPIARLDVV